MKGEWEKKYLAIMLLCSKKLSKSKKAYYMVAGRDLYNDLLARWDWLGFDRKDIPNSIKKGQT